MNYKRVSLRPIHGNLALKFLNWVIKQPAFQQLKNLTYVYYITGHILGKARMYTSAKSLFTQLSNMGIDSNSIFAALMDTYPLCNSNPTILCLAGFEEANIDVEKEENIENESVLYQNVLFYNV
ncbi:unnamed protein product [Lactuca saligna]|uniref:Pentatricopeptide repeat-containing protein n=1 Tax=Lactuca saligna TaxID=75948 RepID=A0AA36E671_LACSI|nr:unnamed protein product [Lactuca saligna]